MIFDGNLQSHRGALNDIVVLTSDKELKICTLQELSLASQHQTLEMFFFRPLLHFSVMIALLKWAAFKRMQRQLHAKHHLLYQQHTTLASMMPSRDHFGTCYMYGHSMHGLKTENTLLSILGGNSQQISLLINRSFKPEPCNRIAYILV